jgi:hypothetical protein
MATESYAADAARAMEAGPKRGGVVEQAVEHAVEQAVEHAAEQAAEHAAEQAVEQAQAAEQSQEIERARDFHFAVTWAGLFAHLEPAAAAGPLHRAEKSTRALALATIPVPAPPAEWREPDSGAAWEMVVPKMVRTGPRTFIPAEDGERRQDRHEERRQDRHAERRQDRHAERRQPPL